MIVLLYLLAVMRAEVMVRVMKDPDMTVGEIMVGGMGNMKIDVEMIDIDIGMIGMSNSYLFLYWFGDIACLAKYLVKIILLSGLCCNSTWLPLVTHFCLWATSK